MTPPPLPPVALLLLPESEVPAGLTLVLVEFVLVVVDENEEEEL